MARALLLAGLLALGAPARAEACEAPRLAFAQPCAPARAEPAGPEAGPPPRAHDPWFGRDKALHAGGSFLLTLAGQYVLTSKFGAPEGEAWPFAASATLSLGLAKEVLDGQRERNPHFSWRDLAADTVGTALAVALILL